MLAALLARTWEGKVDGNGLPRLQIYEYGHLGTGNGAAGLELV